MRVVGGVLLCALLVTCGCSGQRVTAPTASLATESVTASVSATAAVSQLSSGPIAAPDGETPAHAAERLFPGVLRGLLTGATEHPKVVKGSKPGAPVPLSAEYSSPGNTLVQWTLSDDIHSVGSVFGSMRPSEMSTTTFLVPMIKNGRSVCEFEVYVNDKGHWEEGTGLTDPLPGGSVWDLEAATAKLKRTLGEGTTVRPVVFLPSGLEFAVGNNAGREAAVYLIFVNGGPGVGGFDGYLPETGRLFTPAQLKSLLVGEHR